MASPTRRKRRKDTRAPVAAPAAPPAPDAAAAPDAATAGATAARVPLAWSAAVALVALVVYLVQTPAVSGDKDSSEFTLVLALNGVAHPTGYPLYTLFGHQFVLLVHALGASWAYASNAWGAVGGALAMFFLHRLALALVPASAPLARRSRFLLGLLPVALLAFDPIWTIETTLAEVYSWHVAWVLGSSLFFVNSVRALAAGGTWPARRLYARAAAWGLLCGIGGAHHATAIFVAVPLSLALFIVLLARQRPGFGRALGLGLAVLGAALVPLASYLIILWRASHPAQIQWTALTPGLQGLIVHVSGRQYAHNLGRFAPSLEQIRFLRWYVWPLLVPGLVLLAAAAVTARGLAERVLSWTLCAAALAGGAYAFDYGVGDPSSYFLYPMALGLAAGAPVGASLLAGGATVRRAALAAGALVGLAAAVLWVPWLRVGSQRVGLYVSFDRFVHEMWTSIPMDTAIVFWTNDMYYKLQEYQMLGHERPGIYVTHALSLYTPGTRRRFQDRFGFDPTEGIVLKARFPLGPGAWDSLTRQAVARAEGAVNAGTRYPVIHFDPEVPTVRLLRKPGAAPPPDASDSARAAAAGAGRAGR
ncbi:MAG: DUF2723 domain-containing protein [Candidatus Eisenbacteria bacterium]|nr:DUF2723 domain-containing protein [Candidatus Eisenbacteria bacterium]